MHFKCSILDKDDRVLCVVSGDKAYDFQKRASEVSKETKGRGASFNLTAAEKLAAVRPNSSNSSKNAHSSNGVAGSIKLRMVVHLYLPE